MLVGLIILGGIIFAIYALLQSIKNGKFLETFIGFGIFIGFFGGVCYSAWLMMFEPSTLHTTVFVYIASIIFFIGVVTFILIILSRVTKSSNTVAFFSLLALIPLFLTFQIIGDFRGDPNMLVGNFDLHLWSFIGSWVLYVCAGVATAFSANSQ